MKLLPDVTADAAFSEDQVYRYTLTRDFGAGMLTEEPRRHVLWVMLNPSTATAFEDDATIRRCQNFARDWGYAGITVANLFAFRARNPKRLKETPDPVGSANDAVLAGLFQAPHIAVVVAAWGAHGTLGDRDADVVKLAESAGRTLYCMGTTQAGHPRHPLYLPLDTLVVPWEPL